MMKIDAPWLNSPETWAVMTALDMARPGGARFVGGCVRAAVMGLTSDDIDIATQLKPEETMTALKRAGIRAIPTGLEHGTVTAISGGIPYEITSLRRDVETDGRRAVVAFTEYWAEDAMRRDFRLNALYAEADGTVHEGVPGGLDDVAAKRVIFIGEADQRLREDYLRILRFFRFSAWYGGEIDSDGLAACERQAGGLQKIAAERKWKELKRLLEAPDPVDAVQAMAGAGVMAEILPTAETGLLPGLLAAEAGAELMPDAMRRLMALVPRRARDVATVAASLKLSNAEAKRLGNWADAGLPRILGLAPPAIRAAIYTHSAEAVLDRAAIEAAGGAAGDLAAVKELCETWDAPAFPLGGDDALAEGLKGSAIGATLRHVEADWIESDFSLSREDLLKRLRSTTK